VLLDHLNQENRENAANDAVSEAPPSDPHHGMLRRLEPDWLAEIAREQVGRRRFYALAAAIREHEAEARRNSDGIEPRDEELYTGLRRICDEL
jgi:hypothetical protein